MNNETDKKRRIGGKNLVVMLLTVFFALLTGVLGVMYAMQREMLSRVSRAYSTIPLRDDQRRQTVRKMEGEMYQPRFLDDSTILYVSGNSLFRKCLRGEAPDMEFKGHSGPVNDYATSPDRRRVVTGSADGTLRLWDTATGECLAVSERLDTLDQPFWTMLHDVVFQRGGRRVLTADMEGVKVWSAKDLKLLSKEDSDYFYMCDGLLSPDSRTLCAPVPHSFEGFNVYDRRTGAALYHVSGKAPVQYSADGRRLLAASWGKGEMEIWDIDPRTARRRISILWLNSPEGPLRGVSLSPEGDLLVSAHADGTVRVWNALNGAEREVLHWEGREVDGLCSARGGMWILACSNSSGEYCLWGPFSWMI